jgi:hypothetical protein
VKEKSGYHVIRDNQTQNQAFYKDHFFTFDGYGSIDAKVRRQRIVFQNSRNCLQAKYVRSVNAAGLNVGDMQADDWGGECGCGSLPFTTMVQELLNPSGVKLEPCF